MHTYALFDNDAWLYVFMMAFGFTNGYFGSLCMMYGPRYVIETENNSCSIILGVLCIVDFNLDCDGDLT